MDLILRRDAVGSVEVPPVSIVDGTESVTWVRVGCRRGPLATSTRIELPVAAAATWRRACRLLRAYSYAMVPLGLALCTGSLAVAVVERFTSLKAPAFTGTVLLVLGLTVLFGGGAFVRRALPAQYPEMLDRHSVILRGVPSSVVESWVRMNPDGAVQARHAST